MSLSGCRDATLVSSSMTPTIKPGETVTVDYAAYAVAAPKRFDVVAFEPPIFTNQVWLMRVFGLPGEVIAFTNGNFSAGATNGSFSINGTPLGLRTSNGMVS